MNLLSKDLILFITSKIHKMYHPILRLINRRFGKLILDKRCPLVRVMKLANFECVKYLHQFTNYSCSTYLVSMCSQNYSEDKLKSIEYLISVGTPLSKECIGTAIRVNDLRTIELLEHYNCPYPSLSFTKVWNLNIFELFSKRPKRRIKYLSCIPDNQIHLALTAQDKLMIMLKQCIKNHHNDDFKYLWHLYDNIPYALFLQTFEYKNMTLAKFLLDCDRGLSMTPCIYQLVIKSGIDLTYLNQVRALDKDPVSSHMYLDVAKSNVLLLEWFI